MVENILTIALEGDITLAEFSEAIRRFWSLIGDLSLEVGGQTKIDWRIDDLQAGSAIATIRGHSPQLEVVERVIHAFAGVGNALQRREPIPYSDKVRRDANALRSTVKGSVTSIRLSTPFSDALITRQANQEKEAVITYAHGQVTGRVQTLTSRGGLKFTVYDSIFDKPVSCYLDENQEDIMRGAWGRKVKVSGVIGREPERNRPVVVRKIREVEVLAEVTPGDYRHARGAIPSEHESEKSETIIRNIRDAW